MNWYEIATGEGVEEKQIQFFLDKNCVEIVG